MKNIHIILFFTLWVILGSCSTYYVSNKQVMEVQQGMSRQNVEKILGKPDYRRFDGGGGRSISSPLKVSIPVTLPSAKYTIILIELP